MSEATTLETLQEFIGEKDVAFEPMVIVEEGGPSARGLAPIIPAVEEGKTTTFLEDIGDFLVDQLNRRHEPFKGLWLVHSESQGGKLTFTLQKKYSDQHRVRDLDQLVIQLKVVPRRSWWRRMFGWLK